MPGFDAPRQPYRIWVQLLLSFYRQRTPFGIDYSYSGSHSTAIPSSDHRLLLFCLLQRPLWRARLPHLHSNERSSSGLHHLRCDFERPRPLRCFLPVHLWLLFIKRDDMELGSINAQSDAGEESGRYCTDQPAGAAGQYLESVLFPSARRHSLPFGNLVDDGVYASGCRDLRRHEMVIAQSEQADIGRA